MAPTTTPELAYTKALGYSWLRRDRRLDGKLIQGESRLVEIRRARQRWRCTDCGRVILGGKKYGWRQTQRFHVRPDGAYERVGWSEHYCANCIQATLIVRLHTKLPGNRRKGSDYRGPR